MQKILLVLSICSLCSCTAYGPRYQDQADKYSQVSDDSARITLYRTTDTTFLGARSARVWLNGAPAGELPYGSFKSVLVPPGNYLVTTDLWRAAGDCRISIDAEAGQTYFLELTPRLGSILPAAIGMVMDVLLPPKPLAGLASGAVSSGVAVATSPSACSGPFAITWSDSTHALSRLPDLRLAD